MSATVTETLTSLNDTFAVVHGWAHTGTVAKMTEGRNVMANLASEPKIDNRSVWAFCVEYLDGALNALIDFQDGLASAYDATPVSRVTPVASTPAAPVSQLANGFYTVVLDGDDDYVTLKISDDFRAGSTGKMAAFLMGPDNEADYTGFAFVAADGTVKVWSRFANYTRQRTALAILVAGASRDDAALAYAMRAGRCARCGRTLTVPASLHRGYGPECIKKVEG